MPLYQEKDEKDNKSNKSFTSMLKAEIRAVKRYLDCDKKRSNVCSQSIKRPKPV